MTLTRREWLQQTAVTCAAACGVRAVVGNADEPTPPWRIGCFNRPWMRWSYDDALDGIRAAGFQFTGILGDHPGEAFTSPDASADYLDRLKERTQSRGLIPLAGWFRTRHDLPLADAAAHARRQIDHAQRLGLRFLLTVGVDPADQFDHFYRVMQDSAAYAQDRGVQIVLKPHGGVSAAAAELLRCLEQVDHANFRIWYDAGNVIHYTGRDPVAELARVAAYVTGICAKDCAAQGKDVMLRFGTGAVDFAALFATLKAAGFRGPVLVECCAGATLPQVTDEARINREFLERIRARS